MVRLKFSSNQIFCLFLSIILFIGVSEAVLAAMSVDLGNEYTKIALVKPGVPMEIVLNRESQRKTATLVSLRGQERLFGDAAANMRVRYPKDVYGCLIELLGKKFDHPLVHLFQKRFPYYKLIPDQNRGTVLFENDDGATYSVEELVAMLLADARFVAERYAEQPVKDVVITVPAYFNQAERRAMVDAAEIAGVNLLQLMNDNTAAGVNYGMFRRKEFNVTPTTVLIYDMGATKTTATVYEYKLVQDKITKEKNPQMTVLGVGYDRTLGGLEQTFRLRDYFAKTFNEQKKKSIKTDIRTNARSMSKLLKEAERVKKVLSANADHMAQVENLHEELDFKLKITRQELDEISGDVFDRVGRPVQDALKMAELTADKIDYVILMGGGTRSLKVQEKLQAAVGGKDLGKYLNTDEAIAMGAVYQAAHRSKGFKVKKFIINDINLYPIVVDFEKENSSENGEVPLPARIIRRTLFNFKNHYPQKKVMTFSKHMHDFEFTVNYGDLSYLSADQSSFFGEINITRVDLTGVDDVVKEHKSDGADYKGAKAHFRMDDSGVLYLDNADVTFEKLVKEGEKDEPSSAFGKLGKKLSSLFGGGETEKKDKQVDDQSEVEHHTTEKEESDEKPKEDSKDQKNADDETKDSKEPTVDDSQANKTAENGTESKSNATLVEKIKPSIVKIPIKMEKSFMDLPKLSLESLKESVDRLKSFETFERKKLEREKSQNDLESFVLDTRDKLDQQLYQSVTTADEREKILEKLKEASEWLEEQGIETDTKDFQSKLKSLQDVCKELMAKVSEAKDRPKAIEAINQMLNYSRIFLAGMKNLSVDDQIFSETEIGALDKLINDTSKWWTEIQEEQKKLKSHEKPVLTIMSVAEKVGALDREVKYLLNKAKFTKPKPKKSATETDGDAKNETKEEESKSDADTTEKRGGKKDGMEYSEAATEEEIKHDDEKRQAQEEADERHQAEVDSQEENLHKDDEHVEL